MEIIWPVLFIGEFTYIELDVCLANGVVVVGLITLLDWGYWRVVKPWLASRS